MDRHPSGQPFPPPPILVEQQRPLAWMMLAFSALVLLLTLGYSVHSWRRVRTDLIDQLSTVMELGEKALDNYLLHFGVDLKLTAKHLAAPAVLASTGQAEAILQQYKLRNSAIVTAALIRPDGQLLTQAGASAETLLPNVGNTASFQIALAEMRAGRDMVFGRPIQGKLNGIWMLPMRHAIRDSDGLVIAIVSATLPVDVLATFWKDAPLVRKASIGLLGDDGYLMSRYPVPPNINNTEMYGRVRTGALRRHLQKLGLPSYGVVEGYNVLGQQVFIHVFRRLSHHRATLFVAMPRSELIDRWWNQVSAVYAMLGLTLIGAALSYRRAVARQRALCIQQGLAQQATTRLATIVETSDDAIVSVDRTGRILSWNPGAQRLFGHDEQDMIGADSAMLAPFVNRDAAGRVLERVLAGERIEPFHAIMLDRKGGQLDVDISVAPLYDQHGTIIGMSQILRDARARVRAQQEITRLAHYDALTSLPNRRYFLDQLEQAVRHAAQSGKVHALLFLDLDQFKNVNDARGHGVGDAVLTHVASQISVGVRSGDVVARLGGDEFVVLCHDVGMAPQQARVAAKSIAQQLQHRIAVALVVGEHAYSHTASIGISLILPGRNSASDVLREADTAMYRGKREGRGHIEFFSDDMLQAVEERVALGLELTEAVAKQQLNAVVQPQYDGDGKLVGAELLARWNHPRLGQISPERFIPLAEESDLIVPLGEWMLTQGCALLQRLAAQGITSPVSINVSARQFRHPTFVERVRAVVEESGVDAQRLIFEVTESLFITDVALTTRRMQELCALGIRFSIDDFGTGYSSLAYLRTLPLHELKIDRSFIRDLLDDTTALAIVHTILAMAHHLGLQVVAEGVETAEQAALLRAARCDCLQGYYYARSMDLDQWTPALRLQIPDSVHT